MCAEPEVEYSSLPKTPSVSLLIRWTSAIKARGKGPLGSLRDSYGFVSRLSQFTSDHVDFNTLKNKKQINFKDNYFCGLYVHIFSLQEIRRFSFKFASSSNSPSLLKLPMKAGASQCQIPEH